MSRFTLADIFTVLNALSGMLAIYNLHENIALFFLLIAVVCDGLDGFIARRSREDEKQGVVMDSLADAVSFVLFPALCLFSLQSHGLSAFLFSLSAFIYVWGGLYRLSKFTAYDSELGAFTGLPTPEAALLIVLCIRLPDFYAMVLAVPFAIFLSLLMVSNVRYPKMRGKLSMVGGSVILLSILLFFVWDNFMYLLFLALLVYLVSPLFLRD